MRSGAEVLVGEEVKIGGVQSQVTNGGTVDVIPEGQEALWLVDKNMDKASLQRIKR